MKMKETNMDIAEFIRIKSLQNLQTQYLNGKELHNFDFIGIRERFDESVKFFCKTFGVNMPIGTIHNKLVQKTDFKADHNIDPFVRDEAEHLNWTDMILYQNAIKQFEKNRERF